ncbi:hypothetical protein B0H12DRAFT_1279977 [Mycena haematopus]|nr:hypothetical protein B0H12DRAFT_1279977 [Mycena haematopus]
MTSIRPSLSSSHSRSSLSVHSIANTVTSTAALTAAYRPPPKDYAAAFGKLQGQYGTSGGFPGRVIPKKEKKLPSPLHASTHHGQPSQSTAQRIGPASQSTGPMATSTHTTRVLDAHDSSRRSLSSEADVDPSEARVATDDGTAPVEGAPAPKSSGVAKLRKILGFRPKRNK